MPPPHHYAYRWYWGFQNPLPQKVLHKYICRDVPKNDPDNNPEMMIDEPVFERPTVVEEFDPVEPLPEETEVVPAEAE